MSPGRYILNANGEPEACEDLLTWGRWMETGNRILQQSRFDHPFPPTDDQIARYTSPVFPAGDVGHAVQTMDLRILVSTIFLGLDHSFSDDGPPVLFESMIFGGPLSGEQRRYTSRADALAGHADLCAWVQRHLDAWNP